MSEYTIDYHFEGKAPEVRKIYNRLLAEIAHWGESVVEEPKKTSIHLVRQSAFAGVVTRRKWLDLNLRTDHAIVSDRVRKQEQVSKNRYHNEVRLTAVSDVDSELVGWLHEAYDL